MPSCRDYVPNVPVNGFESGTSSINAKEERVGSNFFFLIIFFVLSDFFYKKKLKID